MIQRVQNLYLFLALVCLVVAIFFPIGTYTFDAPEMISGDVMITPKFESLNNAVYNSENAQLNVKEIQKFEGGQFFPFVILNGILAALILLTISKFKSLDSQAKLNKISLIIAALAIIVLIVGLFIIPMVFAKAISTTFILDNAFDPTTIKGVFSTGIAYYLYFAAVAFIFLAGVGIKKDVRLLKSIDRIR